MQEVAYIQTSASINKRNECATLDYHSISYTKVYVESRGLIHK